MRRMRYLCQTQLLTFQSCRYINVHVMQLSMIIFTSPWFFLHIYVSFCSRIFPWLTGGFFFAAQSWVCFPMTLKQGLDLFGGGFGQLRLGFLTGGFPKEKKHGKQGGETTVDGNQKSGKLTSWGTGSFFPIIYRVLAPSQSGCWGFLNHQQYVCFFFGIPMENLWTRKIFWRSCVIIFGFVVNILDPDDVRHGNFMSFREIISPKRKKSQALVIKMKPWSFII